MGNKLVSKARFSEISGVTRGSVTKACKSVLRASVSGNMIDINHPDAISYLEKKRKPSTTQDKKNPNFEDSDPDYPKALFLVTNKRRASATLIQTTLKIGFDRAKKIIQDLENAGVIVPTGKKGKYQVVAPKIKMESLEKNEEVTPEQEKSTKKSTETSYHNELELDQVRNLKMSKMVEIFGTDERFKVWCTGLKTTEEIRYKRLVIAERSGLLISRELVKQSIFGAFADYNLKILTDAVKTLAARLIAHGKTDGSLEAGEEIARKILGAQLKAAKATAKRVLKNA